MTAEPTRLAAYRRFLEVVAQPEAGPPASAAPAVGVLFGRAIRHLREGRALRLRDLAERTGLTITLLSGIELGWHRPRRATADAVAQALDFRDADDLLRRFYGRDHTWR